jgi:hypothetical protein
MVEVFIKKLGKKQVKHYNKAIMNKKEQAQEVARRQLYKEANDFAINIKANPESMQTKLMQKQFPDLSIEEINEILEKP